MLGDESYANESFINLNNLLALNANSFHLLKKYKKESWSEEILHIICHLHISALIEPGYFSDSLCYDGRIFNIHFD